MDMIWTLDAFGQSRIGSGERTTVDKIWPWTYMDTIWTVTLDACWTHIRRQTRLNNS